MKCCFSLKIVSASKIHMNSKIPSVTEVMWPITTWHKSSSHRVLSKALCRYVLFKQQSLTYTKRFLCKRMTFWQLLPTESQNKKDKDLFWVNNKSDVINVYALSLISKWLSRGKMNSLWAFRGTSWVKKWSQQSVSCFWCNRKEGVRQTSKFTEENHSAFQVRLTESVTLVTVW